VDVIFPLSFIKPEDTELEDKTRCSPSPGKVMAIKGDSQQLSEEKLKISVKEYPIEPTGLKG
jgi:hypothetical protein